jgi:HAD superfamily hydrolase (TIGR01509 family)
MNILWDFDGTLFDTYPAYSDIFYEALRGSVTRQEILSQLKVSFSHAVSHFNLSDQQVKEMFIMESSLHPEKTPPFPNVENILKSANVNVIMTHKPRLEVLNMLNYYNMAGYFKELVAGDDGFSRKPDPESYIYLHNKYNIDLVIGDREIDILPAKTLGIKTCLFQNKTGGADFYLENYEDYFLINL